MFSHSVSFKMLRLSSHQPPRAMSTDPALPSVSSSGTPDFLLNARDINFTFTSLSSIKLLLLLPAPSSHTHTHTHRILRGVHLLLSMFRLLIHLKNETFNFSNDRRGTSTSVKGWVTLTEWNKPPGWKVSALENAFMEPLWKVLE